MATIAEFTIPATSFPLGSLTEDYPEATVELERVIPTNQAIIPYFWVRGLGDAREEELEASFRDHPDVHRVELVDDLDGEYLLRVEWRLDYQGVMQAITETDVVLLSGFGTSEKWTFELRADERHAIADFQQRCSEYGIPAELTALHNLSEMQAGAQYDLTGPQREALLLAYERGYYQTPREATLEELAGEVGITGQSLGSRLRRGTNRLIGSTLSESPDTPS
ncbi:helix-turn-helix domain-containing protein [Halobacterium wangiae]|uniref:helix-turn-helix domain-containing protein n=1 Tax=Halobacterium wangiae TaxID=2902623 RepID=UPI001E52A1A6|nr:helix-turn-helix domain-containing protein [Halobacterium wangiae]